MDMLESSLTMNQDEYIWSPSEWINWLTEDVPARQLQLSRQHEIIRQTISNLTATRILDAGCGFGRLIGLLLSQFPNAEITGCDASPIMVQACNDAFPNEKRFATKVGDLSQLPFESYTFDFIICIGVLMHVDDETTILKELCRVLSPGGNLLFSFNNLHSPYSIPWMLHNRIVKRGIPRHTCRTYRYYLSQLRSLGMTVSQILTDTVICIDPSPPSMRRKGLHFIPKWTLALLDPLDSLLSKSPFKYAGFEIFVLAQKIDPKQG